MSDMGTDAFSGTGMGAAFGGPMGAGIGAGAGLLKYFLFDKPANDRQRALAAQTQMYSPWTHLQAQAPDQINPMGAGMQGAAAGASLGQSLQNQQMNKNLQQAQINYLNKSSAAPGTSTMSLNMPKMGGSSWGGVQNPYLIDPNDIAALGQ